MSWKLRKYLFIVAIVIISTLTLWLPFLLKANSWFGLTIRNPNLEYVYKNYDGPLYIVVAKTFYNVSSIENLMLELPFEPKYFAAHLPFYPLLIKLFSLFLGYLRSMVSVNIATTVILATFFYFLIKKFNFSQKPLYLTIIFLMLPRFLIVRSIGAPESIFILLILLSLYFFEIKKFFYAGLTGALATITKSPGILLFLSFAIVILLKYKNKKRINLNWLWIFLIPLGLLLVFYLYGLEYNNFFAYFNLEGNIHLFYPFSVFNYQSRWVRTAWLEDVIFYFFIYLLAVINLYKTKYKSFFYFSLVFFIATTFVQHRDISRYSLPLWPFACIAFEKFFTSKKFMLTFIILLPAIYFFAWNYISYNTLPISDWRPFI